MEVEKSLIESYLSYLLLEKKYSRHTVTAYSKDIQSFQLFIGKSVLKIEYSMIRTWIVSLVEDGLSNRSINRKVSSLNSFYKFLLQIEEIKKNPLSRHKALKVAKRVLVPFSELELDDVIKKIGEGVGFERVRDKLIVELLYSTGIRRSELINLKIKDVDLDAGVLKVLGKRNKERYVPILKSVKQSVQEYFLERKKMELDTPFLFVTSKGNKIYGTLVYRVINSYFSSVSMKVKKSPHVIRHSFATHLLNEGADLNSVKELLGHSSLASTQVYTHTSLGHLKKVYNQAHPRSEK